jgi:hypothetical protein
MRSALSEQYKPLCAVRDSAAAFPWPLSRQLMNTADTACAVIEVIVCTDSERAVRKDIIAFHKRLLNMLAELLLDTCCLVDEARGRDASGIVYQLVEIMDAVLNAASQITVWKRRQARVPQFA